MYRMAFFIVTAVGLIGFQSGAVARDDTDRGKQLQGQWMVTSAQRNGESAGDVVGHRLDFRGKQFVIWSPEGRRLYQGEFRVDRNQTPAAIDFMHSAGKLKGKVWKGVYSLAKDQLKICDNAPNLDAKRPTNFRAPAGSGYVSLVFQRGKPSAAVGEGDSAAAQTIKKSLIALSTAFYNRDAQAIKRLSTSDHLAVTSYHDGPKTLAQSIRLLPDFKVSQFNPDEPKVTMLGERTALVTLTASRKGTFQGKKLPSRYFASAVWVKRDGRWLEAFYQETALEDK